MRGKNVELGIVAGVEATVRNQQDVLLACRCGEPEDVGQELLCSWHVQLATWQHEVGLGVHFPENYVRRTHLTFSALAS